MKIIPIALCLLAGYTPQVTKDLQPSRCVEAPPNRFILVNAEVKDGAGENEHVLFKLEATTGEAWRYAVMNFSYPTRYGTNWTLVEDGWLPINLLHFPSNYADGLLIKLGLNPTNQAATAAIGEGTK